MTSRIASLESPPRRARIVFGLVVALVAAWPSSAGAAPQSAGSPLAAAAADARAAQAQAAWPRDYATAAGRTIRVYEPQIASWDGQSRLVAYLAVAHLARGTEAPLLGAIKVEADTTVSVDARLVQLANLAITDARFGDADRERTRAALADVDRVLRERARFLALDRVLAALDASRIRPRHVDGVKADPPQVFFSATPAILVGFDGDPVWSAIASNDLRFAVNTNWDVFEHAPTRTFYLRHDRGWLTAPAVTGPWTPAGTLPASFARLPNDGNWAEVKANLPGRRLATRDVPVVFVSTKPAELLLLTGAPSYLSVAADSPLLWVHNTESDLFRMGKAGRVYYLVAGRWFSAPDFTGPWTFATPALPPDFARISAEHPRARVLAAVPGTPQAAAAIVLAQMPQTARVARASIQAPEVRYQGTPQFEPVDRTTVFRAVNTDKDVVRVGDRYYLCFQGVWFAASAPVGPWMLAASVPPVIYQIPASSPLHHVTYVTIVDSSADTVVFATAPGYTGVTIAWGCAVWGTGYYYAPYVWYGGPTPVYYPYSATYGAAAWYNPVAGTYQRGAAAAYGPYGAAAGARYDPATGTYARGAVAWGPYGATGAAQAYNPRTGTAAATRQGAGVYGNWGTTAVQRGDDWARAGHVTNNATGVTAGGVRTSDGAVIGRSGPNGNGFVAGGEEGVYAGHDGNVYRRADGGGWQKYENGGWGETQKAGDAATRARDGASGRAGANGETLGQLERDRSARMGGEQRARSGAGGRSGERARPSGGGRRPSGGGRRR